METNTGTCRACGEPIPAKAKVCSQCGAYQNSILYWVFFLGNFGLVTTLISAGLLLLSIYQWQEAKRERVNAGIALETANIVKVATEHIFDSINRMNQEIKQSSHDLHLLSKYSLENNLISANEGLLALGADKDVADRLGPNMDRIIQLIYPNQQQAKEYKDSLQEMFKFRKKL